MRLILTLLCALLAPVAAACANDEFNPYQATLDGMPIADALRRIEAAYSPTSDLRTYDENTVTIASGTGRNMSIFLFCKGKLAGMTALISTGIAAQILEPLTGLGSKVDVYASKEGVMLSMLDRQLNFTYWGVGTKSSIVTVTYPTDVFNAFAFQSYCSETHS